MTSPAEFEQDVFETTRGPLRITFLGHGSLMLEVEGRVIHVDPFARVADYSNLPPADLVLVTHEHRDHLDPGALARIRTPQTQVIVSPVCEGLVEGGTVMRDGDVTVSLGLTIEAVPAYNLLHKREGGDPFHPCGDGIGYVLTIGETRVYVAGDTENTPEMKRLRDLDIAFLPMNLPYTMTPEMVADAARAMKPKVLYPYHYGSTNPQQLIDLLADEPEIEVRIRRMA